MFARETKSAKDRQRTVLMPSLIERELIMQHKENDEGKPWKQLIKSHATLSNGCLGQYEVVVGSRALRTRA